jgi:hypothetical protein
LGCCTCCNGVSTVCSKCFICFRRMLQSFHLDIIKVDRGVAWCVQWLLPGCSRGAIDVGFPVRGARARVPASVGAGARCGTRGIGRDADAGAVEIDNGYRRELIN